MIISDQEMQDFLRRVIQDFHYEGNRYEEGYFRQHFKRYQESCQIVARHCDVGYKILSIGCDPGHIEILLKKFYGFYNLEGVTKNFSEGFSKRMKAFEIGLFVCEIETQKIPAKDSTYDCVLFFEVLEHLFFNPVFALKEIERVLAPQGKLIMSTPNGGILNFV